MSELEKLINELSEDEIKYLEENVFTENGIISKGEQFRFSEFGKKLNIEYDFYTVKSEIRFSPNVALQNFDDEWSWCS